MEKWNMTIRVIPSTVFWRGCGAVFETYLGVLQYDIDVDGKIAGTCSIPEYYPEEMTVMGFRCASGGSAVLRFICEGFPGRVKPDFFGVETPTGGDVILCGGALLPPGDQQADPGDEAGWTASHQ